MVTFWGDSGGIRWTRVRPGVPGLESQLLVAGCPHGRDCRNFPTAAESSLSLGLSLLSLSRHQPTLNALLEKGSRWAGESKLDEVPGVHNQEPPAPLSGFFDPCGSP